MRFRAAGAALVPLVISSSFFVVAIAHAHAAACQGVQLTPSQDVAAAIGSQRSPGTTFCFAAGTYHVGELAPKASSQTFDGTAGAVLDGGGSLGRAFANKNNVSNITIRGFDIRNYANTYGPEMGTVGAWGTGWVVEDNHVHDNGSSGVMVGTGTIVRDNLIDHNGCAGVDTGYPALNDVVQNNEISFNNYRGTYSGGWSCGGGKFVQSLGVSFVGNYSHDNTGWGFWLDGHNGNATVQGNRFANNTWGGVILEINDAAHAGPNHNAAGWGIKVIGNSFSNSGWSHGNRVMYGPAIDVAATNHVDIAGNSIAATNVHAITITYTARHDFAGEDLTVHNISVHDNDIGLREDGTNPYNNIGRVGFYTGDSHPAYHPTAVSFANNRYYFNTTSSVHFSLSAPGPNYTLASWAQWRAAGYDSNSSVSPASQFPHGTPPSPSPSPSPRPSPSPSPSPSPRPSPSPSPSRSPSPSPSPSRSPSPSPTRSPSPSPTSPASPSPSPSPSPPASPSPSPSPSTPPPSPSPSSPASPSPSPSPSTPPPSPSPSSSPTSQPSPSPAPPSPSASATPTSSPTPSPTPSRELKISNAGVTPRHVRSSTTVFFRLNTPARVWIRITSPRGAVLATLLDGHPEPMGAIRMRWTLAGSRPVPGWYSLHVRAIDGAGGVASIAAPMKVGFPPCARGIRVGRWSNGNANPNCLVGTVGRDRIKGLGGPDMIRGGAQTDLLLGGPGADAVRGGPASDVLEGGPGDDMLRGGRGDDLLVGGPGRDVCYATPGRDNVRGCEVVYGNRFTRMTGRVRHVFRSVAGSWPAGWRALW